MLFFSTTGSVRASSMEAQWLATSTSGQRATVRAAVARLGCAPRLNATIVMVGKQSPGSGILFSAMVVLSLIAACSGRTDARARDAGAKSDAGPTRDATSAQDAPTARDAAGASDVVAGRDGYSGVDATDAPSGAQVLDGFLDALGAAMCDWQTRCCTELEAGFETPAACRQAVQQLLASAFSATREAAEQGRLKVDPALAAACVDRFQTGVCSGPFDSSSVWGHLSDCRDVIVGRVPIGTACDLRDECEPGSRCVENGSVYVPSGLPADLGPPPQFLPYVDVGTCLAWAREGAACLDTRDCLPGLRCATETTKTCVRPPEEGEACHSVCDPSVNPDPCRDDSACSQQRAKLFCANGVCRRYPQEGEACLKLQCDPDPALGLTCVFDQLACRDGTCRRLASAGQPCGDVNQAECGPGLACLTGFNDGGASSTGVCGSLPRFGEPCATVLACVNAYPPEQRCVNACQMFPLCAEGVCDSQTFTCVPDRNGPDYTTACTNAADCLSGDCEPFVPGPNVCVPHKVIEITCRGFSSGSPDGGTH